MRFRVHRRAVAVVGAGAMLATFALAAPAVAGGDGGGHGKPSSAEKLARWVKLKNVLDHLEELQEVSDDHGDRAAGRSGYDASVDYVVRQLRRAGYHPEVQDFTFTYTEDHSELAETAPTPTTYVTGEHFLRAQWDTGTPMGESTAVVQGVDVRLDAPDLPPNTSSSGCEAADFDGFVPGNIALVQRGTCGFAQKVLLAEEFGASAVIVMNEGQPGRRNELVGMIGDATGTTLPAVFAGFDTGAAFLAGGVEHTGRVVVDFFAEERTSSNVLAETRRGDDENVVMAGAHLDSVQDGAGINDNGSGSAALLETAIQAKKIKPNNTVRFAWWGAEEEGLLGSEHYVAALPEEELADIALYLNFDMVGSPNYFFGVYDGDNSSGTADPATIPPGSAEIEDVFEKFFADAGQPSEDTEFSGRSDYGPFIAVGVPAGGLFTGAEGVKTEEQAARYGGLAGEAFDPCYHAFCDNLRGDGQDEAIYDALREVYDLVGNVNTLALDVNADAIATAVGTFAMDTSTVNGVEPPRRPGHRAAGVPAEPEAHGHTERTR